jgi:hypothetical protein
MKIVCGGVIALLLFLVLTGGGPALAAGSAGPATAPTGQVTLASQARWVNPVAINVEVSWQCSDRFVAVLRIEVAQQPTLIVPTRGVAHRAVVCDAQAHSAAVTVHALLGTFQLGDAFGVASLTLLHGPPETFTDERPLQIVAR